MNVEIRPQRVSDAKRYFEILSSPNFHYLPAKPKTLEEERCFLKLNSEKRRNGTEFNFSIIYNGRHVGAIGVRLDTSALTSVKSDSSLMSSTGEEALLRRR
jgi:ribosomal-protein-alanine N-acetyltransferase